MKPLQVHENSFQTTRTRFYPLKKSRNKLKRIETPKKHDQTIWPWVKKRYLKNPTFVKGKMSPKTCGLAISGKSIEKTLSNQYFPRAQPWQPGSTRIPLVPLLLFCWSFTSWKELCCLVFWGSTYLELFGVFFFVIFSFISLEVFGVLLAVSRLASKGTSKSSDSGARLSKGWGQKTGEVA